jgi:RNA polymerase sigma factor for flagellar operon FliA
MRCEQEDKDFLVREHSQLVRMLAEKIQHKYAPHIYLEELIQEGNLGLLDAAEKFDESRNIKFKTYAEYRIRGAMLDYVRDNSVLTRNSSDFKKKYEKAIEELSNVLFRTPREEEIAHWMEMGLEKFREKTDRIGLSFYFLQERGRFFYLEDKNWKNPAEYFYQKEIQEILQCAMENSLTYQEKLIIDNYFLQELKGKEIASMLGVSEKRISFVKLRALKKMRTYLKKNVGDLS